MSSSSSLMSYIPSSKRVIATKEMQKELVIHNQPFAEGGYGSIFRCEYNDRSCIAKRIPLHRSGFIDKPFEALLMACNIPYVNKYRNIFFDATDMYIIQNIGVSMRNFRRNDIPSYEDVLRWFKMLTTGLKHLHRCNIIHGDIKPDNTLIFNTEIHLSDLGLASLAIGSYDRYIGTASYRPPEVWNGSMRTVKSDIWCLGLTMYYLVQGEDLFSASGDKSSRSKAYRKMIEEWSEEYGTSNSLFKMNPRYPLSHLIYSMLNPNPHERPSCNEILSHPLLKKINIYKHTMQEVHVNDIDPAEWIYTLISHKVSNSEEGMEFSKWFVDKIVKGHHINAPNNFLFYERWLISNRCYLPKYKCTEAY